MTLRARFLVGSLWLFVFAIATSFWYWHTVLHGAGGNQLNMGRAARWIAWGNLAGLYAATGALFQLLLISRTRWLERPAGLDRLTNLHIGNGRLTITALAVHVLLVTQGHALTEIPPLGFVEQIRVFLSDWDDLQLALVAAVLLLIVGTVSFPLIRPRFKYEIWYALHLTTYAAIALAFFHQIRYGNGLTRDIAPALFRGYWYGLYACAFGLLLFYRVGVPLYRFARHGFTVQSVTAENEEVTSLSIQGRDLSAYPARAGQFVFVRFLARGFWWEKHPFSLSNYTDGKQLRLTIKKIGDFTSAIPNLPVGTRILVDGPYGALTADRATQPKILLIAGGIGITPLRALLEAFALEGRDIILLYANRNEKRVVFLEELARLARQHPQPKVHVIVSHPEAWPGERGTVDEEKLRRLVPDLTEREVFLCGPPPMMDQVRKTLRTLGVPGNHIHFERFRL
jgi:predicted ferric reductase